MTVLDKNFSTQHEWKKLLRLRVNRQMVLKGTTLTRVSKKLNIGYATLLNMLNTDEPSIPRADTLLLLGTELELDLNEIAKALRAERDAHATN
jgi:hypothetical protein